MDTIWGFTPNELQSAGIALGLVVVGMLGVIGRQMGKWREHREPPRGMQIAGALIDGSDARRLTEALDRNTTALKKCSDTADANTAAIQSASREIQRLTDETIRGQR